MSPRWTLLALLLCAFAVACTPTRRGGGGGGGDDDDSAADDDDAGDDDDVAVDDDDAGDDDDVADDDDTTPPQDDDDVSSGLYAGSAAGAITIAMLGMDLPCTGDIEFTWDGSWASGTMTCADTMYGMACEVFIEADEGTSTVDMDCMGTPGETQLELDVGTSGQIAVQVESTTQSEYGEVSIAFGGAATEQ